MKHFSHSLIAFTVLVQATAVADSALVPVKLQTLVQDSASHIAIVTAGSGPAKGASATALYYVSASSKDTVGNPLVGTAAIVPPSGVDGDLGFAWLAADGRSGLAPLSLGAAGGSAGGHAPLYAFPRAAVEESLASVSGGGVTVQSNANAGGAVWQWTFHGKNFIDDYDYGRQLSMAIYTNDRRALQEAGDGFGGRGIPLYARHPAPTAYLRTSGSHQSSRAVPLEWSPADQAGSKDNPVIYINARLGKELSLDWVGPDGVDRHWPVAAYECDYEGPAFPVAVVEAPTAYLTAEFNHYYRYDPKADAVIPVTAYHTKVNISAGEASGLILASGSGPDALAMGIYVSDPNAGLVLYDNSGPDGGQYGSSFSKWGVVYRSVVSAQWKFRVWITTDTVRNIQAQFRQLRDWGVRSRDPAAPAAADSKSAGREQFRQIAQQPILK